MRWTWDIGKAKANRTKHGLSFETRRWCSMIRCTRQSQTLTRTVIVGIRSGM
jgi:uncharacterized DUF497 family protein